MPDRWDFYHREVDGEAATVAVNLGLLGSTPQPKRTHLCKMRLPIRSAGGLPDQQEASLLNQMETALVPMLLREADTLYVGRLTYPGRREMYFYSPDPAKFESTARPVLSSFPTIEPEFEADLDEEWFFYNRVLYPSPRHFQAILNRQKVKELEREGDQSEQPRPVDHVLYFPTLESRDAFVMEIEAEGFHVIDRIAEEDSEIGDAVPPASTTATPEAAAGANSSSTAATTTVGTSAPEPKIRLEISRLDTTDIVNINAVVDELFVRAKNHGGRYDGWSTVVATVVEEDAG